MTAPALLRRFPRPRKKHRSYPVLDRKTAAEYPALAADIAVADEVVGSVFAACDTEALRQQNGYRLQQVLIIFGSALLSGLGGLQAALPGSRWPGLVLIALSLALGFLGRTSQELQSFEAFLAERVKAERLRSAYFRYLSRTGRYAKSDRDRKLREAVLKIKKGEEPS